MHLADSTLMVGEPRFTRFTARPEPEERERQFGEVLKPGVLTLDWDFFLLGLRNEEGAPHKRKPFSKP